jgi:RimJ/RimL family protein N-acetyltransferase
VSARPKTILDVSAEEAAAIRAAVLAGQSAPFGNTGRELVTIEDAQALADLFADPDVNQWIYDLPRPPTTENTRRWIDVRLERARRGEAILTAQRDESGRIVSYSDLEVWPDRSAAELIGGARAVRQNTGSGSARVASSFDWIFETLGVRLICATAALDNVRSARAIDNAGFVRMGERDCVREDGSVRPSLYWEMTREQWRARKAAV